MSPFENKLSVALSSTTDTTREEMVKETESCKTNMAVTHLGHPPQCFLLHSFFLINFYPSTFSSHFFTYP